MNSKEKNIFLKGYDEYADAIYRYCYFRVYSKARAEELAQETFMKTWQYVREGKKVDNLRAFLYRTATNLIIDDSRKKKEDSLDAAMEKSDAFEPSYDGAKDIEKNVALKDLVKIMEDLDEDDRRLLTLRYLEDLDPKDISKILDITPNNVSVKINRALEKLRQKAQH